MYKKLGKYNDFYCVVVMLNEVDKVICVGFSMVCEVVIVVSVVLLVIGVRFGLIVILGMICCSLFIIMVLLG